MKTNNKPLVSIIIPVFNGALRIRTAVESVLGQTFNDFEIIVVDDGSTDNTKAILDLWIKEGAVRYIYQQNKGPAAARNIGIREAKGKYLKFLDSDDLLYSEQLERQVQHLKNKPSSIISATDYELEFESKRKISINLYLKENQLAQFIEGNPCPIHTILVERSIVEKAGAFDEKLKNSQDSDLWFRLVMGGNVIEKINYTGCLYRILSNSNSSNPEKMFLQRCLFYEKINSALMPQLKQLPPETLKHLYFKNLQIIHQCFARDLEPSQYLRTMLKVNGLLYAIKASAAGKIRVWVSGFKNVAWKEYQKARRIDPRYADKLISTAWRTEEFYQWEKFSYLKKSPRNKKIKNILYLNSSSVMYGAETRLLDIIRNLDTDNFHPFVLLPHPGPLDDKLKEMGVLTMHLEYGYPLTPINRSNIIRFLRLNRDFVRLVRRYDIDLIHANLHINMGKFWLAFLILRLPLIVHMRSHFMLRAYEKFIICRASKAIFISKFVEKYFFEKSRYSFLVFHRPERSEILHDGIDVNYFCPETPAGYIRRELKIDPKDFLIGIIGAVDKVKGQDLLIQAANIVVPKHPHVKIVVVGDLYHASKSNVEYRDNLLTMIKDFNLNGNVIFTGVRNDIKILMTELDLLVQPSEREALGTSMVEAMACGKPVIGSDLDGIPEVIGNNESGILLNPRTPEAFAKAINFFIENPEEARKRGAQGRERALTLFNVFKNIKRIENMYHQSLGNQW